MDCSETKVGFSEEELLEPLIITEDEDTTTGEATSSSDAILQSCGRDSALEKKEEHLGEDEHNEAAECGEMHSEELKLEEPQSNTEPLEQQHRAENEMNTDDGLNLEKYGSEEVTKVDEEKEENMENKQKPEGEKQENEDAKKAHRLTPDFPDSLFELLCTLQEGRRLNDQRCSFRLEGGMRRRRCHSEPNTRKPANRVVFSSMTSLQKEEFFDLVATAQARRLDDQRAQLGISLPPKTKSRSFRGSLKQLSLMKKPEPAPAPKEDLYDMILTTQAQGRLEDQRSRAPGPMDDEDFFSLLLKVQGGRMDEQRTELPRLLKT
ncbi:PREDICTED: G-protein-signaling modulator 2-like [Cyprinodon variegatus]|uniref:G-protein-signaling modulator 2-like n=1 Tax=Cyprinodon variegatus TaxID=28743 RepID=A0A3Q2EFS9_CYPVA|nr:PREDICTED: G-protein-signaling modulator 2-like [Cyprinodon variegatus]XP_015249390.1 PREDICTED: G-protein-signaling modulator 2-like [Cyprinodon variegatus]